MPTINNPYKGHTLSNLGLSSGAIDLDAEGVKSDDSEGLLTDVVTAIRCSGTAGNVTVETLDDDVLTEAVSVGGFAFLGVIVKRVLVTGTTATGLIGYK